VPALGSLGVSTDLRRQRPLDRRRRDRAAFRRSEAFLLRGRTIPGAGARAARVPYGWRHSRDAIDVAWW